MKVSLVCFYVLTVLGVIRHKFYKSSYAESVLPVMIIGGPLSFCQTLSPLHCIFPPFSLRRGSERGVVMGGLNLLKCDIKVRNGHIEGKKKR